jgi:hypothetical protein
MCGINREINISIDGQIRLEQHVIVERDIELSQHSSGLYP